MKTGKGPTVELEDIHGPLILEREDLGNLIFEIEFF